MADHGEDDYSVSDTICCEDYVCLSCVALDATGGAGTERVCLAAEGFGNRMCFLQPLTSTLASSLPFDMGVCAFSLEQALSVRALQEMVSAHSKESTGQSGHRTLLYGHAVLLRHCNSSMYLSCLSTQGSSNDKLAFDVGLTEKPEGESCWWTIHPASKQRSEGEKVRVGDDLILVSVASERYLHLGGGESVIATFQQTLWSVQPISSGAVRQKSVGYVFGGDVLRFLHGDECLTIPARDSENIYGCVMYETGAVFSQARSLWKLEHIRTKWAQGCMSWGSPCRLRHVTSGRYLGVTEDNQVITIHRSEATEDKTAFVVRQSKDDRKFSENREEEGMGSADMKYGDSLIYFQHLKSGYWLSYQTFETKKRGVGRVEEKKAVVMVEGHMDDGVTASMAQEEENKSARVIRKCTSLITTFVKALDSLKTEGRHSRLWAKVKLAEVIKTLEDLIDYFSTPGTDLAFEERQIRLKALRNRQDLFQEEGMIALTLDTIDHCSQFKSIRHLAHIIGDDSASRWSDMIGYLYLLLAAMIRGNRANCAQFASSKHLDWLVHRLDTQEASKGVLDVLHCVLTDSPEALNVIKDHHIRTIISLIDKHGRDPLVMDVLCCLCEGNGVAVRSNQNLICENLLPTRDLLLQTRVVEYVHSMHPNIYVGRREGSAMFLRWYYEAVVDHIEPVSHLQPHLRIGWANTEGYVPYPGGGFGWGCNGVGDDLFSYSFDGANLWTGGRFRKVRLTEPPLQKGDIIGVCLDLTVPQIFFTVNGVKVRGLFRDFNVSGLFFPVISLSAKVSIRFILGGENGKLKHGPPDGYSPVIESLLPKERLKILPCFNFGDIPKKQISGPMELRDQEIFVPVTIDATQIQLPTYVENVREKLAENCHEVSCMTKIDCGWVYGEKTDELQKVNSTFVNYDRLASAEKHRLVQHAQESLRTILAMGYHMSFDSQYASTVRWKTQKLPNQYIQSNGYKPLPLDLSSIMFNDKMADLANQLAENTHNTWVKERIKQGWTYGLTEDSDQHRSPQLVPYSKLEEKERKAIRDTAVETVKTLMAYGYTLEAPVNESGDNGVSKEAAMKKALTRTYRAENTYAVSSGKWYYEFEVMTTGMMRVGWLCVNSEPDHELGCDSMSYVFDGSTGTKWHQGAESYGKLWQKGDVVGCMLDMTDKTVSFSLNGELMMDRMGQEIAFKGVDTELQYVPAFCLASSQQAKVNFGQDVNSLKFFIYCGLQEGYEPFCVNMTRTMPMWYAKQHALFESINKQHAQLEVVKVPGGSSSPPCLKINSKTYGTLEKVCFAFLRLSLPVKFNTQFVSPKEKAQQVQARLNSSRQDESMRQDDKRRGLFKKKSSGKQQSVDDSSMDTLSKGGGGGFMRRQSSETNLATNLPTHSDGKTTATVKSGFKSPFKNLLKKKDIKSRTTSPFSSKGGQQSLDFSEDTEFDTSGGMGPEFSVDPRSPRSKSFRKTMSEESYSSDIVDADGGDGHDLESNIDIIDEYYYGIRVFPGQDPALIYVGWVTPQFHEYSGEFDMKKVRNVVVCTLDIEYQVKGSVSRKNCYLVSAGDLYGRYGQQEEGGKRMTPGLLIGCHCDTSTGILSFSVNGREVANKFQVEPATMLYPAVFFEPTNKEILQFELGRTKNALPLSAALFRNGKHVQPQCPPRLEIQHLLSHCWSRVPLEGPKVHTLKLSSVRGWSMLCEEGVSMMAVHIPEEDRSLDMLELIEHQPLLDFHAHTLQLYRSVSSQGNHRVAHELIKHVNEAQLMYCIDSKYLAGPLRMGLHNLLISLHTESHAKARLRMQNEYMIPLGFASKKFSLFRQDLPDDVTRPIKSTIPALTKSVSIKPQLVLQESFRSSELDLASSVPASSPSFPMDVLKQRMMSLLTEAVEKGQAHIRDPIGGSNEDLFVPLLRVVNNLLLMGLLTDEDLSHLLMLISPCVFDVAYNSVTNKKLGLLQMKLAESVKLELVELLHHLCDIQLRHRVESIIAFADGFVAELQIDQKKRYIQIKQTEMPMAVAAKKTREFRCPPFEQMKALLQFRDDQIDMADFSGVECACPDDLRQKLKDFEFSLLKHCFHPSSSNPPPSVDKGGVDEPRDEELPTMLEKVITMLLLRKEKKAEVVSDNRPEALQKLITEAIVHWARSDFISSADLIRAMFRLLHRQYCGVEEVKIALAKTYVISHSSKSDIEKLLLSLGHMRGLLSVQVGADEEEILKNAIWELADNRVFFQHPNLILSLRVHETVMQLMMNTLNKVQQQSAASSEEQELSPRRRPSVGSLQGEDSSGSSTSKDSMAEMVVSCCRFLCYFCRTGAKNQAAMYEHLGYLLENSSMLLSRPSLRGSCPLDVAYSSFMDNNELALALGESDLDKVAVYLSRCGQQSNQEIIARGYPDIGWDPVEGERFLDFFRFCVLINGESVEENANLVVRLLIRRPECLGPNLRGEGGGLLKAFQDGIIMSEQIAAARSSDAARFLQTVLDEEDDRHCEMLKHGKFDFSNLPPEEDEDYIDLGDAILSFYSSLALLLGYCAPDAEAIKAGRSDSIRARAILRSLVSMEDLEGVLQLRILLPTGRKEEVQRDDGTVELVTDNNDAPGLQPQHKASVLLFLEKVYGIPDQMTFFRLLEECFLPDLRGATILAAADMSDCDVALALNRYLCNAVLPLLTSYASFFSDADHASGLLEATLHIVYTLSKCRSLTKIQREKLSDFLIALTSHLRPPMMTSLLRILVTDVAALTDNTLVPLRIHPATVLQVLTNHYERCGQYYGSGGWGSHGTATEEEKRLTMMLFSGIFDALAQRAYDPELFSKALPCLAAIACALPPDYSLSRRDEILMKQFMANTGFTYQPQPTDTSRVMLTDPLQNVANEFAEHLHDSWAVAKMEQGWIYGQTYNEERKQHHNLKSFKILNEKDRQAYQQFGEQALKAMLAWGWTIESDATRQTAKAQTKRRMSKAQGDYQPRPSDLRSVNLPRSMLDMAEKVAVNAHALWALNKLHELESIGVVLHNRLVDYSQLTSQERKRYREKSQDLFRFLQLNGFRVMGELQSLHARESTSARDHLAENGDITGQSTEKRFAFSLLEKLLDYVDKATYSMRRVKPGARFTRRNSYCTSSEDVKFFGKVVLPLVEKYFRANRAYFIGSQSASSSAVFATIREKEITASLFSKFFLLLRQKLSAFGFDIQISVRCLQALIQAIDCRALAKNSPEIVRSSLLPFFVHVADDLVQLEHNLHAGLFSHIKGTMVRGATSLNFVHMVVLPVLTSMYDHLGRNGFGSDLLVNEQQLCCYRIFNALYRIGTQSSTYNQREFIMAELARNRSALGECIASFAGCFPVAFLEPTLKKFNKYSIVFGIEEEMIATHSLEAKEVLDEVSKNLPPLEKIVAEIVELAASGGKYNETPHVIEVTLPMLCSYLPFWWSQGPDNVQADEGKHSTTVTAGLMNSVLGNVLKLIKNNIGIPEAPWMNKIATRTGPIIVNATADMLKEHFLPVCMKLKTNAREMEKEEIQFLAEKRRRQHQGAEDSEREGIVQEHFALLVRDIYAFYPLLIKYVDLHRSSWLKNLASETELLYLCVAEVFNLWSKSHLFKKEEQNFVYSNEINNMALIMPSQDKKNATVTEALHKVKEAAHGGKGRKKLPKSLEATTSLNVACLKRLLPIGLNMFGGREQKLLQQCKERLIENFEVDDTGHVIHKDQDQELEEWIKTELLTEEKPDEDDSHYWQKMLYKKIVSRKEGEAKTAVAAIAERILAMAKVMHGLHMVDHPSSNADHTWKRLLSSSRKRAVIACFRILPVYNQPRHRAINLFLKSYSEVWLTKEPPGHESLIEDITSSFDAEQAAVPGEEQKMEETVPQPLAQLITTLSRQATSESAAGQQDDLYINFANIMSQSCHGADDDDNDGGGDGEEGEDTGAVIEEQEMEKQKLLFEQSRLANSGAAEMVLMYISSSRGQWGDMVMSTIELGISILRGGNTDVQKRMLNQLREKKDVGFFTSLAVLMQQCSVLDLDAFERSNKAEGLGTSDGSSAQVKNLADAENICKLFRFLQLLCEGHNLEFQNYLRAQAGNTSTVNIVICSVDYLLRLQESIMDFYWHYSSKESIDIPGRESFFKAINVAAQIFRTITEYIQGPCHGNQLALAHSRLWDAVGGFMYIFAHMGEKLSRDPEELELLRQFMQLQKEMMIMLLSMLEGNVVNGPIGKQMVDTLVESAANFEMILRFFDIFLKMKDMTTSEAFMSFDINKDGIISHKEFRRAMEIQKIYSPEEIEYIMMCVDSNQDGKIDFVEFTDRFHNPAKDIGFSVAILLTNISEHMPNDQRMANFMDNAKTVVDYFEPFLGRIEIMGGANRIERVYFEITQQHIDQWEKPQIRESKRAFLHGVMSEEGEAGKLEQFVNFCEDTIFEMQHAASISMEGHSVRGLIGSYLGSKSEGTKTWSVWDSVTGAVATVWDGFKYAVSSVSPSNIRDKYNTMSQMTYKERIKALLRLNVRGFLAILTFLFMFVWTLVKFVYYMMSGDRRLEDVVVVPPMSPSPPDLLADLGSAEKVTSAETEKQLSTLSRESSSAEIIAPVALETAEAKREQSRGPQGQIQLSSMMIQSTIDSTMEDFSMAEEAAQKAQQKAQNAGRSALNSSDDHRLQDMVLSNQYAEHDQGIGPSFLDEESERWAELANEPPLELELKEVAFSKVFLSMLARNYYNFKLVALFLAFAINFILLFFKASKATSDLNAGLTESTSGDEAGDSGNEEEEVMELISMAEHVYYLQPLLRLISALHTIIAFAMMVAYYCLKVPLVVFKREKEISRRLEFDGMWIANQPSEDDIKGHWDKLVISTRSFPDKYWDKFVKKKVISKYSEQYDFNQISSMLGIANKKSTESYFIPSFLAAIDWQYQVWKWGIIFTDNSFLYIAWYVLFSILGNFNPFFFAAHLLDVAICFKTLGTILQSVTHNGKQLVLTVLLLVIIVYLYTVIAFNFFRKFYVQEGDDGQEEHKCQDMLTCYKFHLYSGVRAGGGIGDEIEPPEEGPYEVYRIIFDITFFFFVIVILLAIMQGLIIDAFGDLRDQLEQVKDDLESSCFICGIGKDYFDSVPHGFETHVKKEHNFANYLFFMMYIINKDETEHTGQETYVWQLYQQRCWDFFPVGECFRKQYESELGLSGSQH